MTSKAGRPTDLQKDKDILSAARKLLFSEGPQALTMENVAKHAGVSKVTLYTRYPNRHQLLQAVVSSESFVIHNALLRIPGSREDLCRDLGHFAEALSAFICKNDYQRLIQAIASIPQKMPDMAEVYRNGPEKTRRVLAAYLEAAAKQGLIRCPEPTESAELLMGMIMGLELVRGQHRVPFEQRTVEARRAHAGRIVAAFLSLSAEPGSSPP